MPSIIIPNSIALYNECTGDIWYIRRKTGEITPNRDIFYGNFLSLFELSPLRQTRGSFGLSGKNE